MVTIRQEKASDVEAREVLLDIAYGAVRLRKPSARLRSGRAPARGLAFVAVEDGHIVGTVRLWAVTAGSTAALLVGPLAVDPVYRRRGIGAALMRHALAAATRRNHQAALLVGDAGYYGRFGFSTAKTGALWLPGLSDKTRLLGFELRTGSLDSARGMIRIPDQPVRQRLIAAIGQRPQPKAA